MLILRGQFTMAPQINETAGRLIRGLLTVGAAPG
jgi:hypothetical protein